jgi:DNA adenine methylase
LTTEEEVVRRFGLMPLGRGDDPPTDGAIMTDEGSPPRRAARGRGQIAPRKLRSLVKMHGGKSYLARRIIGHFPAHETYTEPFAGGLNVLLNKRRAPVEVVGDLDPDVVNLWTVLRDRGAELAGRLAAVEYTEANFDAARAFLADPGPVRADDLERAAQFVIRDRFSRNSLGEDWAWSERLRRGVPEQISAWETIRAQVPLMVERLQGVGIRRAPAIEVIRQYDAPDAHHYCDPTYLHSTRTVRDAYRFEMSDADHAELLDVLVGCRGTVVLSGYPSAVYDTRLAGWRRISFDMANHSGQTKVKQRRTEVIWMNR